ncbi:MAG: hypothetical protein COT15_02020 [Candidatus Diapherotrites archaeon CG08_land_8_20_14_0_20_34_12]|nr:MAG: hypothetical protein COT15_02020 [Candidatus Diapherotrites archaeon CG08_land_8_20_14_0_20_34_12]
MHLSLEEKRMLLGKEGNARKKAMQILLALGKIYGAKRLIPVHSVQIAGVSYHNLGDAGLEFLQEIAKDGKVKAISTLNPAGMDLKDWKNLGISEDFAKKQIAIVEAFKKMNVNITLTCTPYLIGYSPEKGEHIAWSESSAVCYANSVLGAYTNMEGGPSALASALTGLTPEYGVHLETNRQAQVIIDVKTNVQNIEDFGALGKAIATKIGNKIPYIRGIEKENANLDCLKNFCASLATFAGLAIFHMEGITPNKTKIPKKTFEITLLDLEKAKRELYDKSDNIDLIAIGCPHCSIEELKYLNELLEGKKVKKEFWVCVSRKIAEEAERQGYLDNIKKSGAKIACDTCMAVAPLKGRFNTMLTNSAKACFYGRQLNSFKIQMLNIKKCVEEATKG